ncbi:UDP-GlcNAc:betaGal beta-1,3-N-acetylglucosaminyltransferase 7 [Toxocara canis]|uniref:Hexosyltransferase n=1 Tax=Toxocara canis TaxID=6265 RepID=A0A0B2VUA2_TOXCA|nr:UDP-GlcNAc:betaGal beta-1,3-N-acetylglucosaminyltransferase 7 [Toxocara canis]
MDIMTEWLPRVQMRKYLALCLFGFLAIISFIYSNIQFSKVPNEIASQSLAQYLARVDQKSVALVDPVHKSSLLSVNAAATQYFSIMDAQLRKVAGNSTPPAEQSLHNGTVGDKTEMKVPPVEDDKTEFRYALHKSNNFSDHFEPFPFLVEPRICKERRPAKIVIYVGSPVTADDIVRRSIIRNSWAADAKKLGIETVFSTGRDSEAVDANHTGDVAVAIEENKRFGDILMVNYRDRWDHLILKWWTDSDYHAVHCDHIPFMAVADSDSVVLVKEFSEFLDKYGNEYVDDLGCSVLTGLAASRVESDRYYVSEHQWPNKTLPPHCHGAFIMASAKTARKMSEAVPILGIDYVSSFKVYDVVLTSIAQIAHVKMRELDGFYYSLPYNAAKNICASSMTVIHSIKPPAIIPAFLEYRLVFCALLFAYKCLLFAGYCG